MDLLVYGIAGFGVGVGLVAGAFALKFLRRIYRNGEGDHR